MSWKSVTIVAALFVVGLYLLNATVSKAFFENAENNAQRYSEQAKADVEKFKRWLKGL